MGSFPERYNDPLILDKFPTTFFEESHSSLGLQLLGSQVSYSINKECYSKNVPLNNSFFTESTFVT